MTPSDDAEDLVLNAHIDSGAALHGLTIQPHWRPDILGHLRAIEQAARLVLAYKLDDHIEAAPIFEP